MRGERNQNSKLTDAQRRGVELGILQPDPGVRAVTHRELAEHFGVHPATIGKIRRSVRRLLARRQG